MRIAIYSRIFMHPSLYMYLSICIYIYYIYIYYTSSTAQGRGGSFRIGSLLERLVVVNRGWQSESTDGLDSGWIWVFWSDYTGCSGHLVGHLTHDCWK